MIPRTVLMAQEVAAQFTPTQIDDYGNIFLNGYLSVVPNTANKKAWQYQETLTAPVNLPSLSEVRPALKGWTTNYMEYYTQLQPNGYDVNPGDPTMFTYSVHSFSQETGGIATFYSIFGGTNYTPGTYLAEPLSGGSGTGATADIIVTASPPVTKGPATGASFLSAGSGYSVNNVNFSGQTTVAITGTGSGLRLDGRSNNFQLVSIFGVFDGGNGYEVGDIVQVDPGTGTALVDAVGYGGTVTSITIINPGSGYKVNDTITAFGLPDGSGFYAQVATLSPVTPPYGEPFWAQTPRRFFQNQVADFVPPTANQQAIPYSFMYPVADNPTPPPIDTL
jgi:hypothetical protein